MTLMPNWPEVIRTNLIYHGVVSQAQATFVLSLAEDESSGYLAWIAGNGITIPLAGKLDKVGRLLIAGRTQSTDLAVQFPVQGESGGSADGFVGRLLPGGGLDLLTYLGGSFDEEVRGVDVDAAGTIHLVGFTSSTNFPVTTNVFLSSTNSGLRDAFVVRLDSSGTNLIYGTYVGGIGDDEAAAIAVDSVGVATVVGVTSSPNFPTVRALQSTNAGITDAFVFQLDAAGLNLDYSTYLGGPYPDLVNDLERAPDGTWWLVGLTGSTDQNQRWGAPGLDTGYGGGVSDGWVVRLTSADAMLALAVLPGGSIRLSWPAVLTDFAVQRSSNPADAGGWTDAGGTPVEVGSRLELILPAPTDLVFFRLRRM
jgi:hypothetical protein